MKEYYEKIELENFINDDGGKISILSHLRSIGDRTYRFNLKILIEGVLQDETIQTKLPTSRMIGKKIGILVPAP